jgi:preprotein translocase subunit YajC
LGSVIYLLVFAVIIFMLWTTFSQQRRAKRAQEDLQRMLKKGDEVVTVGGMFGTIRKIGDDFVVLEIADRTRVRFLKRSIRQIVNEEEDVDEDEDEDEEYVEDDYEDAEYEEEEPADEATGEAADADEADDQIDESAAEPADGPEPPEPPTSPKGK